MEDERGRINLFIDTNIFLAFYHFTSEDLEELKKLIALLESSEGEIKLFLPEQVVQEFYRNRENKIASSFDKLRKQNKKFKLEFPQYCKDYKEYKVLIKLLKECEKLYNELILNIREDIRNKDLKADYIIQQIFELSEILKTDDEIIEKARIRIERGNPPGKKGSLGDALNWEVLLEKVPNGENLYFISDDKDFISPIDKDSFNTFLFEEWQEKKNSNIIFYKSLSQFFRDNFPNIKLASELEKEILIKRLLNSRSFAETHEIIAKLNKYDEFSEDQIRAIAAAYVSNNQIYWIINDTDVMEFILKIIKGNEDKIDSSDLELLNDLLNPGILDEPDFDSNNLPF